MRKALSIILVLAVFAIFGCGPTGGDTPVSDITIDGTPPAITSTAPANSATGVAINKVINIFFSEAIDAASVDGANVSLIYPDNSTVGGKLSTEGSSVVIIPGANLKPNSVYTVKISGVKDLAGNSMAGLSTAAFTTGSGAIEAPTVISTIPNNNSIGVAINSSVVTTFNKAINCSVAVDIEITGGGKTVSGAVACSNNTITFTPSANLDYGTTYTVSVNGVVDATNSYAMGGVYTWSFTTGFLPDTTPPTLASTVPANSGTDVSLTSNITVTFSENIYCTSVTSNTFTVSYLSGPVAGTISCSNNMAVFDPSSNLAPTTVYTARIYGPNGIKDAAGNYMTADYLWSFTTKTPSYITAISGGLFHTVALKGDKTVIAWGSNSEGQLGTGTGLDSTVPVSVSGLTDVIAVDAGGYHNVALKTDGTVWTWGSNGYGQIGDGTTIRRTTPGQVQGLTGIVGIAVGDNFTLALKSDGTVWAWGDNTHGQIGNGTSGFGNYVAAPVQVVNISDVAKVSGGGSHSLVLKSNGTVWAWGSAQYGQVGNGTSGAGNVVTSPVQVSNIIGVTGISAGKWNHSLALKSDGTVWSWGANTYGQLGIGTSTDSSVPVKVSSLSNVSAIAGGEAHSLALKSDGTVWSWGANTYGQLGDGTPINRTAPVQVVVPSGTFTADVIGTGFKHSLATKNDGTAWAWGLNASGQLGTGNVMSYANPATVSGF